jgi:hypothetical protein
MKKDLFGALLAVLYLAVLPVACRKSLTPPVHNGVDTTKLTHPPQPNQTVPYPETGVRGCSYSPNYGDTLIYPQPTIGPDYIVYPINNPGAGRYFSWPQGMVIDSVTGAINVTKSETGEKFDIGFVKTGSTDTCLSTVILGGASYMDSVYTLANNETKAYPYFNANPSVVTVPSGSQFDITKDAYNKKINVNKGSGMIDLNNTLNGGAFGAMPFNGQTIETTMYYNLNDLSNKAMQQITVQLMYYEKRSQISAAVLNDILLKRNNILAGNPILKAGNPRPPLIIITRFD